MAGGRVRLVQIVNRTTDYLDCMYDGVPEKVPAGYKELPPEIEGGPPRIIGAGPDGGPLLYTVEYYAAECYKRQHPRMGTQDPFSVDARDTEYLMGIPEWGDDVSHVEQTDADELIDRTLLPAHRQNAVKLELGRNDGEPAKQMGSPKTKRAMKDARKLRAKKKAINQDNRRARYGSADNSANPFGLEMNYRQKGER